MHACLEGCLVINGAVGNDMLCGYLPLNCPHGFTIPMYIRMYV